MCVRETWIGATSAVQRGMMRVVRVAVAEVVLTVVMTEACQANTDLICHGPLRVYAGRYAPVQPASDMQKNQPQGRMAGRRAWPRRYVCMYTSVKLPLEPRSLSCVACPKLSRIVLLDGSLKILE